MLSGKLIVMHDRGKWSDSGYHAIVTIDGVKDTFIGSSWPNPFKPSNPTIKLDKYAGAIRSGTYVYQYSHKAHNGDIGFNLRTENGIFNGNIPTINANPNQNNQLIATNIDIHSGSKPNWRGSLGCITINPYYANDFFANFNEGEQGLFILERDYEEVS